MAEPGPIRLWQLLDTYNEPPNFWERAAKLGDLMHQYTDDILHDAASSYAAVSDKIDDFKGTMSSLVSTTGKLRQEFQSKAFENVTLDQISEMLSKELSVVVENLQDEFPSPDHAEHHEERVQTISRVLAQVEACVVRVSEATGVSPDNAVERALQRYRTPP